MLWRLTVYIGWSSKNELSFHHVQDTSMSSIGFKDTHTQFSHVTFPCGLESFLAQV